jgi:hypothetical protein
MSPAVEGAKPLGSLAQAARGNELKQAQRILIVIGLLTLAVNGFNLYNLPNEIQQAIQQNQIPAEQHEEARQKIAMIGYLLYGLPALLGVLFVVFGVIIHRFPVAITVTSLVLYVLATVAFALIVPASLAAGIFIKIIIIIALFRAIKAARAYESHAAKPSLAGGALE